MYVYIHILITAALQGRNTSLFYVVYAFISKSCAFPQGSGKFAQYLNYGQTPATFCLPHCTFILSLVVVGIQSCSRTKCFFPFVSC